VAKEKTTVARGGGEGRAKAQNIVGFYAGADQNCSVKASSIPHLFRKQEPSTQQLFQDECVCHEFDHTCVSSPLVTTPAVQQTGKKKFITFRK
jgi:hypothetical protein